MSDHRRIHNPVPDIKITCKCGSNRVYRAGHYKDKQRVYCKDRKLNWTLGITSRGPRYRSKYVNKKGYVMIRVSNHPRARYGCVSEQVLIIKSWVVI
jgi:hypothetical protein